MAIKYDCWVCKKQVAATKNDRYRSHQTAEGKPCPNSSSPVPEHILAQPVTVADRPDVPREGVDFAKCPQCTRKVKLTRLGYFEPHDQTLRGGDRCPVSGVRAKHARRHEDALLPGDEPASPVPKVKDSASPAALVVARSSAGAAVPASEDVSRPVHEINLERQPMSRREGEAWNAAQALAPGASSSASTETGSPAFSTTSTPSTGPGSPWTGSIVTSSDVPGEPAGSAAVGTVLLVLQPGPLADVAIFQPLPPFLQPTEYGGPAKAVPMTDLAKELATKIKETFYAYSNRRSSDNRSAQTTLGPSEIGTPCDRRLAMALMGIPAVNPGGDGWASFVGTCGHVGMGEVYTFADAGTGRYAVELPVFLGIPTVPRGTTDLLDRRDGTVVDWKFMGSYSLNKFKTDGPSLTYRTQAHVYGLGAERAGEKVRNVAVVGLPRAGSSLDEMHVWTEKYDRKFAQAALDRVEKIANEVAIDPGPPMMTARRMSTGDDCRFCQFHLKNDKEMKRGCPGK